MNRKMSKRQRDIKSKLMAAICMLLVSSIMMVSTTYAWFTLSTAPEVTGITTAVGANGNLEMALMPLSGNVEDITSDVGDSMSVKDKTLANTTWGNLVDLEEAYGLQFITLYPSALNVDKTSGAINTGFPVAIPEYGVDGRVTILNEAKAVPGYYNGTEGFLNSVSDEEGTEILNPRGVRAIGVASGASPAQLAYKAALLNASSAAVNAKNKASGALVDKGGLLAGIAVKHANGNDEYDNDDVANLQFMVDAVQESLTIIENAIKEYVVAAYISTNATTYTEETMAVIRNATSLSDSAIASYIPEEFSEMIGKLNTAIENANTADDKLATLTDNDHGWTGEIADVVSALANPSKMNLNGFAINDLENHISDLFTAVTGGDGINLYLESGAGVFVDIADLCGNYSAPVVIPEISHPSVGSLTNVKATMHTQSDVTPTYLNQARATINESYEAPGDATAGEALPLSDFYGYIIDLAFRTNVAGSNLQLQTAAVDRIYSDNTTNEATLGGGSTMVFKSADSNFTADRMIELMNHLKVVLFDPDDGTVIKNLVITNVASEIITDPDGTVTAPLYVAGADGTPATKVVDGETVKDPTIVALDQNTVKQISALVYLDGTNLTNADVANAAQSMAGALNLQFSSSAELVPMEYADLRNGTVAGGNTPVVTDVTAGTVTGGYNASLMHIAVGETYKIVAVVTETDGDAINADSGVTVEIDGKSATYGSFGAHSGWVVDGEATVPTNGTVSVTVTPSN